SFDPRDQDPRNAVLLRPDAVPGISADTRRWRDGAVSQSREHPISYVEGVPFGERGAGDGTRTKDGVEARASVRVPDEEGADGGVCPSDGREGGHHGRAGVRVPSASALPNILLRIPEGQAVRAAGTTQMRLSLLLLHGPTVRVDPCEAPDVVSDG